MTMREQDATSPTHPDRCWTCGRMANDSGRCLDAWHNVTPSRPSLGEPPHTHHEGPCECGPEGFGLKDDDPRVNVRPSLGEEARPLVQVVTTEAVPEHADGDRAVAMYLQAIAEDGNTDLDEDERALVEYAARRLRHLSADRDRKILQRALSSDAAPPGGEREANDLVRRMDALVTAHLPPVALAEFERLRLEYRDALLASSERDDAGAVTEGEREARRQQKESAFDDALSDLARMASSRIGKTKVRAAQSRVHMAAHEMLTSSGRGGADAR
jgi:hypothetical protein